MSFRLKQHWALDNRAEENCWYRLWLYSFILIVLLLFVYKDILINPTTPHELASESSPAMIHHDWKPVCTNSSCLWCPFKNFSVYCLSNILSVEQQRRGVLYLVEGLLVSTVLFFHDRHLPRVFVLIIAYRRRREKRNSRTARLWRQMVWRGRCMTRTCTVRLWWWRWGRLRWMWRLTLPLWFVHHPGILFIKNWCPL